jgi:hypothetical protein
LCSYRGSFASSAAGEGSRVFDDAPVAVTSPKWNVHSHHSLVEELEMALANAAGRLLFVASVFGVFSLLVVGRIDLAAKGSRADGGRNGRPRLRACETSKKSAQGYGEESDETSDATHGAKRRDGDGVRADANKQRKRTPKRLENCDPPSSGGVARGDFNGDGVADLAVGVPFEDEDFVGSVGAVNVIYGSAAGLTSSGDQYLTELMFGYPYATDDRFGAALASGDFNGDGFSDLAIGMPGRERFGRTDHGAVLLIDGSAGGLVTSTARTLELVNDRGGAAGSALVWADFDNDGFGDLAVGIPRSINTSLLASAEGEVQVFYGRPNGLTRLFARRMAFGNTDRFGAPLAAGDFNADGFADLAMGAPSSDVSVDLLTTAVDAGVVILVAGSVDGLQDGNRQVLHQEIASVNGIADDGDQFGFALAVGDFDADLRDDLAVGVPGEDFGTATDTGAVHIFLGGRSSVQAELVDPVNDLFVSQLSLGENRESDDRFGRALAAGRFNNDFRADLAIGSPGEDVNAITDAGMVSVVYGADEGVSLTSAQHWHQNVANIPDTSEAGDEFGRALSAWNYGKTAQADLAIGVPFEDLLSTTTNTQQVDAGAVVVIYGSTTGLTGAGSEFWHQDRSGISGAASAGDRFGVTLY